jgi:hypothetical protein
MLRRFFCKDSREDKVFHLLKKKGLGLEIGPSHNPTAPKSKGGFKYEVQHVLKTGETLRTEF